MGRGASTGALAATEKHPSGAEIRQVVPPKQAAAGPPGAAAQAARSRQSPAQPRGTGAAPQPQSHNCVCGFRATWQDVLTVTHLSSKGKQSFPAPFNSSNAGLSRGKEPPAWHQYPTLVQEGPQCCAADTGCTCVTHTRRTADGAVCPVPPRKATLLTEVARPTRVHWLCRVLLQPRLPGQV